MQPTAEYKRPTTIVFFKGNLYRIKVLQEIGKLAVQTIDGIKIYRRIRALLRMPHSKICVDFTGVCVYASDFMCNAMGELLKHYNREVLNDKICVEGLTEAGSYLLELVMKNAELQYQFQMDKIVRP